MNQKSSNAAARRARWLAIVAATLALSACALGKMGYQQADTVGLLWINRYLDLNAEQKDFVKPRMKQLLAWHRSTQLPDYATFAAQLQKRADADITVAEVATVEKQFKTRAETTIEHAIPDLADLALVLKPENVKAMQEKFVENDKKFRDDNKMGDSVEKQLKARYDKTLERVEDWYGRFDRDQRARIRKLSDARPLNNAFLLAERQRRQSELIALLERVVRDRPPREQVIAAMKSYADRFEVSPDRERRAFQDASRKSGEEMNAAVHNLATPEQRARAAEKLQQWSEDLRDLAAAKA